MQKLNHSRARRAALASLLALPLATSATLALTAAPAVARAHVAAKKKSKGFTVKLKGGTLTLTFTAASWSKLSGGSAAVGTTTTPIAPATSTPTGSFSFPISGGTLNSATGRGTVSAKGGFTRASHLSIGPFESSTSASVSNPSASLGSSATLVLSSPNFTPSSVPLFKLATTHVKALGSRHAVSLSKIPASLTPAGLQFFGSSFKAGETVATVSIAAKG